MLKYNKAELGKISKRHGFVRDTLEKVLRLKDVLEYMTAFDLADAEIDIKKGDQDDNPTLRTSLVVEVYYYVKDGKYIATYVTGYGSEVGPIDVEDEHEKGYILSIKDDIMYLDLENPGPRKYKGEGEDRAVPFDTIYFGGRTYS